MGLENLKVLAEGLDHPEGVTVDPTGVLYAGGEAGQIYRVDVRSGGVEQVATTGGFMLGLCADASGLLYCCDVGRKEVVRIDPHTGDVTVYSNGTPDRPMVNPNWPVFDDTGNLYVTDSGSWKQNDGCILRIDAGGKTSLWTAEATGFPNGAALSADGESLFVLESTTPALVRIPIRADGSAGPREVVTNLVGVPDGCAIDTEGRVYVFYYRPDRIDRVSPDGRVEILAEDPEGTLLAAPTNGVWLAPERRRLVVGSLGRWHLTECDFNATGIPLRYPKVEA
ncbi:MAG: SMP-30/gluconolactonase/LRE family protein [Actinomycetota bacterium]|nr:SMP-30/gluconolactonase/LRE family protein [Actinomycetota bacterium]